MWQIATSDITLVVLLLSVATGILITAWLPQVPSTDPRAYAHWLSEAQKRFGETTAVMRNLGLFTVTRSFGFRTLVALLGGCLLLRLTENVERLRKRAEMIEPSDNWQELTAGPLVDIKDDLRQRRYRLLTDSPLIQIDRWPWADLFPTLIYAGAVLLMGSLLITHLWGWQVEDLIIQNGERASLPRSDKWVALSSDGHISHSPGLTTFIEDRIPGVQIQASDDEGQPLPLQQTVMGESNDQLTIPLTTDQYFAIPEAQLIARLTTQPDAPQTIHVQVYRSPAGRLVTEEEVAEEATVTVNGTELTFASHPFMRLMVTFNPGRWPTILGVIAMLSGLLGSTLWPRRRFWLREEDDAVEGAGDLPPALASTVTEEA
jgi:cytochrome c biogenesis protein ResB